MEGDGADNEGSALILHSLRSIKTGDHETELAVQMFGNTAFVVVTQLQKIGTLVHIVRDAPIADETTCAYKVKVLMGGTQAHQPQVIAFCQWFAQRTDFDGKVLLLSLAIRDWTATTHLRSVVDAAASLLNRKRNDRQTLQL